MTTTADREVRTNQTTTTPVNGRAAEATHPVRPDAAKAATTTPVNGRAGKTIERIEAPSAAQTPSATSDSPPNTRQAAATRDEPTADSEAEFDFDDVWSGVRASIERARHAIPDWIDINTPDDLNPAIDEALRYLAQTPIPRGSGGITASTAAKSTATDSPQPTSRADQSTDAVKLDAEDLDEHLAAVDAAYARARAIGIPPDRPEWAGISAIHSAIHNLWDTIKAAAGTYWAELAADIRVHGLLTTLATRAIRAIANLANTAADHIEQRTAHQQRSVDAAQPTLREAYITARGQIRAHAASHEWQRITALWGTVNTLARQAGDPGIRAVIARSADAISDYADSLSRKTSQYGHTGPTEALATLAASAERHAATLRAGHSDQTPAPGLHRAPTTAASTRPLDSVPPPQQATEAQLLQARARQVAQHAQARLSQTPPQAAAAPRRAHSAANARNQDGPMRPAQPNAPRNPTNIQVR